MRCSMLFILFLVPPVALADFEMRFSDGSVGAVGDGNVRFGDENEYLIALAGEDSVIVVSNRERTWMRLNPGAMDAVQAQMEAQMQQMLAAMPPEQRAMVEQQMGQMMPQLGAQDRAPSTVTMTGSDRSVAGYDCSEAEVRDGNGSIEQIVCIATPDELGVDDDDFDTLASAMRRMADIASMTPSADPQMDFVELGGIPISTRESAYGANSELVSVDTGGVPSSLFEVPDGYRELSMQDMMRQ